MMLNNAPDFIPELLEPVTSTGLKVGLPSRVKLQRVDSTRNLCGDFGLAGAKNGVSIKKHAARLRRFACLQHTLPIHRQQGDHLPSEQSRLHQILCQHPFQPFNSLHTPLYRAAR